MKKTRFLVLTLTISSTGIVNSYADNDNPSGNPVVTETANASYISAKSYLQNPYVAFPSLSNAINLNESIAVNNDKSGTWLSNGTWNVLGSVAYVNQQGYDNYGYGANIFAQSGELGGFSVGALLTAINIGSQLYPANVQFQSQGLPVNQQIGLQELFAEYRYANMVEVAGGYIGINNPWMTYYQNNSLNLVTYQGVSANVYLGGGWLLSGFLINGAELLGENGFSDQTLYNYNPSYNAIIGTPNTLNDGSPQTIALGASWSTADNNLNLRAWGYQFANYANLFYTDLNLKLIANDNLNYLIGVQGLKETGNGGNNALANAGYGDVDSNALGILLGLNYAIFNMVVGYDDIWGPATAYGGGAVVSPYSYGYANDPLYTTGWATGMVERAAGSAYKITPSLNLLGGALVIGPSYEYFATDTIAPSTSWDLNIKYAPEQIRGFTILFSSQYLLQQQSLGGNTTLAQIMFSYLY